MFFSYYNDACTCTIRTSETVYENTAKLPFSFNPKDTGAGVFCQSIFHPREVLGW